MSILEKILLLMLMAGVIGCLVNAARTASPSDWRNHIYSSFLIAPFFVYVFIELVFIIIKS